MVRRPSSCRPFEESARAFVWNTSYERPDARVKAEPPEELLINREAMPKRGPGRQPASRQRFTSPDWAKNRVDIPTRRALYCLACTHARVRMVAVAQLAERQIVALEVAGSRPVSHPLTPLYRGTVTARKRRYNLHHAKAARSSARSKMGETPSSRRAGSLSSDWQCPWPGKSKSRPPALLSWRIRRAKKVACAIWLTPRSRPPTPRCAWGDRGSGLPSRAW